LEYKNETERMLLRYLEDLKTLDFSLDQAKSLLKELAFNDDTNDWAAGKACAVCPPPDAREEFYNYIYGEIQQLYCQHDDSAVPIAEYIVQEIKTNTRSKEADRIRKALKPDFHVMMYDGAVGSYASALMMFKNMVDTGKPWDHKPIIMRKFKDQGVERPNGFNGEGNIYKTFYTKYKDYDYFYDVWSNIHYGYIGRSIGFSEIELTAGSNVQQLYHDAKSLSFNSGDTGSDKATILIGIALYEKFGEYAESLTAQDILDALDSNEILLSSLDQESKQTHWCWHSKNENPKKKRDK